MKIFLDTSSLVKLYHKEADTDELENLLSSITINTFFLSEISKIEFASTVWKKVRTNEITELEAQTTLGLFESDFEKFVFIPVDSIIIEHARNLISTYGTKGLRTLDGIQLSTSVYLSKQAQLFITSDNLLKSFLEAEGLPTQLPIH